MQSYNQFLDQYKAFLNEKTILAERFFHDPAITNPAQCICDICMTVEGDCGLNNVMWVSGGQWIVYHFHGVIKDIFETLQGVFSIWLPQSGYRMTRPYGLNIYRHIDRLSHRVEMDLCIPVS